MEPPVLATVSAGISMFWLIRSWLSLGGGRRGRSTALFLVAEPRRTRKVSVHRDLKPPQRDVTDDEPRQGAGLWPREGDSRARSGPAPVGRVVCISKIILPGRHVFRGGIVRLIGSSLAPPPEPPAFFLNFAPCKCFGLVAGLSRSPLPTAADQV